MKKVLLIGDSIRLGYDRYVKESLKGQADVVFPAENCRFTGYILRYLHIWTEELNLFTADAVHWNVGHWDTVRIYGDEPLVSELEYAENLNRITARLRFLFPKATLIFATSTPVLEDGFIPDFEMRYNRDVEKYNEIAKRILVPQGVVINDLYELLKNCPRDYHSDQTHFYTAKATELLGGQVNRVLCDVLSLDVKALTPPDSASFEKPAPCDREIYEPHGPYYSMRR